MNSPVAPITNSTRLALLAGPAFVALGMALTPWEEEQTTASYQDALAAHPTQGQLAALALVAGYALMALAFMAILSRAHAAPRPLRVVASVAAFLAVTVLPGLVCVDAYDLALAQHLPQAQAVEVADAAHDAGMSVVLQALSGVGFLLGTLLVMGTAWRARLVGAWAPALTLAGLAIGLAGTGAAVLYTVGALLTLAAFSLIAFRPRPVEMPAVGGVLEVAA